MRVPWHAVVLASAVVASTAAAAVDEIQVNSLSVKKGQVELVVTLPWKLETPAFLGWAFARTAQADSWTDLPHVKVLPEDSGKPITLRGPLAPGFTHFTVVLWDSECDNALCDASASFPKSSFVFDGTPVWAPAIEIPVAVKVLDAGGGPEAVKATIAKVEAVFATQKVAVKVSDGGKAQKARTTSEVLVRNPLHLPLGVAVQRELKTGAPRLWPQSTEAIVIAVGP